MRNLGKPKKDMDRLNSENLSGVELWTEDDNIQIIR